MPRISRRSFDLPVLGDRRHELQSLHTSYPARRSLLTETWVPTHIYNGYTMGTNFRIRDSTGPAPVLRPGWVGERGGIGRGLFDSIVGDTTGMGA